MTTLDVIDMDEILNINSMWQNKFFEPWAKVGAALDRKLWENENSIFFNQKTVIIEYDGSLFFIQ